MCRLQTPEGSSIVFTDERFKQAEKFIIGRPEVINYFAAIGGFTGGEVNSGMIFVTLKPFRDRPVVSPAKHSLTQAQLMSLFRQVLNKIPDLRVNIREWVLLTESMIELMKV